MKCFARIVSFVAAVLVAAGGLCACVNIPAARAALRRSGHLQPDGPLCRLSRPCLCGVARELRPCRPGELGVVISRYDDISGYDWIAVPLLPYLYAVDSPADIPQTTNREQASLLRDLYRRHALESVAPDAPDGTLRRETGMNSSAPPMTAHLRLQPRNHAGAGCRSHCQVQRPPQCGALQRRIPQLCGLCPDYHQRPLSARHPPQLHCRLWTDYPEVGCAGAFSLRLEASGCRLPRLQGSPGPWFSFPFARGPGCDGEPSEAIWRTAGRSLADCDRGSPHRLHRARSF